MAVEPASPTLFHVPWLRLFPALRLFRGPGAAAEPKRLVLAALGLLLLKFGWGLLDLAFPSSSDLTPPVLGPWAADPTVVAGFARLAEPVAVIVAPFVAFFRPGQGLSATAHATLAGLWAVVVWGVVGGALARVAALDLARSERVGLIAAIRFAGRKAGVLIGTPLLPLVGVGVVAAGLAAFGLIYRLPDPVGANAAGALAFLPLLGGLVLAVILVGLGAGWPLMHASVAAEAEDSFDAMSRSYAYVRQRPWHLVGYLALAAVLGVVALAFVNLFADLVVALTAWGVSLGAPADVASNYFSTVVTPEARSTTPVAVHSVWLGAVALLARGWVYSYFWTTAVAVYLLLRREVDGTPLSVVAGGAAPSLFAEAAAEAEAEAARPHPAAAGAVPAPHAGGRLDPDRGEPGSD